MADLVEVFMAIVALIIMSSPVTAFEKYPVYFPPYSRMSIGPDPRVYLPKSYAIKSADQSAVGAGNPFLAHERQLLNSAANPGPRLIAPAAAPVYEPQEHGDSFNASKAIIDIFRSLGLQNEHPELGAARAAERDYGYGSNAFDYSAAPHNYWTPYEANSYVPAPHPYPPAYHYGHPTIELHKPVLPKPVIPKPVLPALPSKPWFQNNIDTKPTTVSTSSKLPLLQLLLKLAQTFLGLQTGSEATASASTGASGLLGMLGNLLTALFSAKPAIKAVIGKLTIPIVVLVLANIELLTLIWWLWEDCSTAAAPVPEHQSYDYNYYETAPYQPQSSFMQY